MRNITYLDAKMVPASLRGGYSGKMFKACVCESMTIPMTAGLWDGGSRDSFRIVRMEDGREHTPAMQREAPWGQRCEIEVKLEPGIAVIEHSIFCGKDMGLTIYVHPENAAKLLPAPVDLSEFQRIILKAISSYKSSYSGMDRYEMCLRDHRYNPKGAFPSRAQWDEVKLELIAKGFLNKAGAITTAGKNAVRS